MNSPIDPALELWRTVGDWGFILVIVGVVGEVISGVADIVSGKSIFKKLEIVFGAILIIGLGTEYLGHKKETSFLNAKNGELYAVGEKAKDSAQTANQAAEKAKLERSLIEKQEEEFRQKNLELQAKVLEMEAKLRDRTITDKDRNTFIKILSDGKANGKIVVIVDESSGREGKQFAEAIRKMIISAGFNVPEIEVMFGGKQVPVGVAVGVLNFEKPPEIGPLLQTAFRAINIPAEGYKEGNSSLKIDDNTAVIWVGTPH